MKTAIFGKLVSGDDLKHVEKIIRKMLEGDSRMLLYEPFYHIIKEHIRLDDANFGLFSEPRELKGNADILFSLGGDGTVLDAFTLVRDSGIPVAGVNIGRLGFLSSISRNEILSSVDQILNGEYVTDRRALLELEHPKDLFGELNFSLNDFTVTRKDSTSLIVLHVYIDDIFLNTYWADGLIVATPTGSTAYSLSCGGPIITPGSENFVITPIAPHNLTVRPIVIPDKSRIRIIVEGRNKQFLVSMDSRVAVIQSDFEIKLCRAPFSVNLIQLKDKTFFGTIRDKLKWGLDVRN